MNADIKLECPLPPPSVSEATVLCDASFMNRSRDILAFRYRVVELFSRGGNFNSNRIGRTPGEKTIVPQMRCRTCA